MRKNTYCIALTGGIASGKTTVSQLFERLGVPIIDADVIAHELASPNGAAYTKILAHFGDSIRQSDNTLNRKKLRTIIFSDPDEKQWLENVLHPMIRQAMREEIAKITAPYCICVIPLLAEASGIDFIDRTLVIETSLDKQLARAKKRDDVSDTLIQKMIDAQVDNKKRRAIADDVITNDGSLLDLTEQVNKLHQHYLEISG